mmetsp:Transcript_29446/g.90645  ORF Transcript_29446/g.90645 Transcript_29446/m.90645 type:complete len:298 (+) Transcript_29446:120-1013(+)
MELNVQATLEQAKSWAAQAWAAAARDPALVEVSVVTAFGAILLVLGCRSILRKCWGRNRTAKAGSSACAGSSEKDGLQGPLLGDAASTATPSTRKASEPSFTSESPRRSPTSRRSGRSPSICPAQLEEEEGGILDDTGIAELPGMASSFFGQLYGGSKWLIGSAYENTSSLMASGYQRTNSLMRTAYQRTNSVASAAYQRTNSMVYQPTASVRYERTHSEKMWMGHAGHYEALEGKAAEESSGSSSFLSWFGWGSQQSSHSPEYLRTESATPAYEKTHTEKKWQAFSEALEPKSEGA